MKPYTFLIQDISITICACDETAAEFRIKQLIKSGETIKLLK